MTRKVFEKYSRPASAADAAQELSGPGSVPMGGGTDLLVSLEEGFAHATTVVDLRGVAESDRRQEHQQLELSDRRCPDNGHDLGNKVIMSVKRESGINARLRRSLTIR